MRNIFAIFLTLCVVVPMMSARNNENIPKGEDAEIVGVENENGVLSVYVSADADDSKANGRPESPYATIQAAKDAVRTVDRGAYSGIDVIVKSGIYPVAEPISFDEADGGTETCPVRYVGEDGVEIVGGITLTAEDFSPATGAYSSLFPEDARDKIVQIDLTELGFTADDIAKAKQSRTYYVEAPAISVGGVSMHMARFPNEDWINVGENSVIRDKNGEPTTEYDDSQSPVYAQTMEIWYPDEYAERVRSWSNPTDVYVVCRLSSLWCTDDASIISVDSENPFFTLPFTGGHGVIFGAPMYWYNIPEELDVPGEYIIDDDGILYIYPTEDFTSSLISIPLSDGIISMDGTDYIAFENLVLQSSLGTSIYGTDTDFVTIKNCEIGSNEGKYTVRLTGNNITIEGNYIHDIASWGLFIDSGDLATLTPGNTLVYNNYFKNTSLKEWPMNAAICVDGVENTVSHNELDTCYGAAISNWGAYSVTEYNYIHDAIINGTDMGAIASFGTQFFGCHNTIRYNYLKDIGPRGALAAIREINEKYFTCAPAAIYPDGATSSWEAYGNIIENVYGFGFMLTESRELDIHNNLTMNCRKFDVGYVSSHYANWYEKGDENSEDRGLRWSSDPALEYICSDVWVAARPSLSKIVFDLRKTTADDMYSSAAPAENNIYDNYVVIDKANRWEFGWKGTQCFDIEKSYYLFSEAEEPSSVGKVTVYSSKRRNITAEEAIELAAGVVDMTVEQFRTIGIIAEDWRLDVEFGSVSSAAE